MASNKATTTRGHLTPTKSTRIIHTRLTATTVRIPITVPVRLVSTTTIHPRVQAQITVQALLATATIRIHLRVITVQSQITVQSTTTIRP